MTRDDDFVWHIRLEGDEATRRAGAGARDKAAEAATGKSGAGRFLDRITDRRDDERAWHRGAEGEEQVGRRLDGLAARGWAILHDLTIGPRGANLDHLAIGPGGVFVLNTKNHLGKKVWAGERAILVNGQRTDHLRSIEREVAACERALSAAVDHPLVVRGVIVVLADELTIRQQPAVATVVARRRIARWLTAQEAVLSPHLVRAVGNAARLPSTWGQGPKAAVLDTPATSSADATTPVDVSVTRWRRYGRDRLYANRPSESLGYFDVNARTWHPTSERVAADLRAAVESWLQENGPAGPLR